MQRLLVSSLFLLTVAACDQISTGDYEQVDFTPTECGVRSGCGFADAIAVGGELTVRAAPTEGAAIPIYDLQTADPRIADVNGYYGNDEWSLVGLSSGATDLIAFDANGDVLDVLLVYVEDPTELLVDAHGDERLRERVGSQTVWSAREGDDVEFDIRPARFGSELMGNMLYNAVVSASMARDLDFDASPGEGRLRLTASEGEYDARFTLGALSASLVVDVAPAPEPPPASEN